MQRERGREGGKGARRIEEGKGREEETEWEGREERRKGGVEGRKRKKMQVIFSVCLAFQTVSL